MTQPPPSPTSVGLALSGGGFRATLFHLGSLWRLNELGVLKTLTHVTSVSGGSIVAAYLGLKWPQLTFDAQDRATNFEAEIAKPIQAFCARNIQRPAILKGLLMPWLGIAGALARQYDKYLFNGATLQALPSDDQGPRFIIYATNLQTGVSFRFMRPYVADYLLGKLEDNRISLATAVTASSAFPPVFSPVVLKTDPRKWTQFAGENAVLAGRPEFTQRIYLADGGVYDNLALEAIWDRKNFVVLACDAGAPYQATARGCWWRLSRLAQMYRVLGTIDRQNRALRKRVLVDDFKQGRRRGSYWGIGTEIGDYAMRAPNLNALVATNDLIRSLAQVRTSLNRFSAREQAHLINWGYALADAAVRCDTPNPKFAQLPPGAMPMRDYPLAPPS